MGAVEVCESVWFKVVVSAEESVKLRGELPNDAIIKGLIRGQVVKSGSSVSFPGRAGRTINLPVGGILNNTGNYRNDLGKEARIIEATIICFVRIPFYAGYSNNTLHSCWDTENTQRLFPLLQSLSRRKAAASLVHLTGVSGTGKSFALKAFANLEGCMLLEPTIAHLSLMRRGDERAAFSELFLLAENVYPSILVFDNAELWFPVSHRSDHNYSADLLAQLKKERSKEILIVVISRNHLEIDARIRSIAQVLCTFQLPSPQERFEAFYKELCIGEENREQLRSVTDEACGYSFSDIRRAVENIKELNKNTESVSLDSVGLEVSRKRFHQTSYMEGNIPKVSWDDIGGHVDVKRDLEESIIWAYKHRSRFESLGVRPTVGILLIGPPGTGKTLLAKAVASQSKASFFNVKIPDVMKAEMGESEKILSNIFQNARINSPSVVFIDEIQAIFGTREADTNTSSNLVSQLMYEMDRLGQPGQDSLGVTVLAATNMPEVMDRSLFAGGRFERLIYVPPPDEFERAQILGIHCSRMPTLLNQIERDDVAKRMHGYTGAEIQSVCRQAGLCALRRDPNTEQVIFEDFASAISLVPPQTDAFRAEILGQWVKQRNAISRNAPTEAAFVFGSTSNPQ